MTEFFIHANSFAAPFFSDPSEKYVEAETPEAALLSYVGTYAHPCGLYAAYCYASADAMKNSHAPLATWLCNHEIAKAAATKDKRGYSYYADAPGHFRINDEWFHIPRPKDGCIVSVDGGIEVEKARADD